jgi:hypothetical protein
MYVSIGFTFQSYELYSDVKQKDKTVITIATARWKLQWRLVVLSEIPPNHILKWHLPHYKNIN